MKSMKRIGRCVLISGALLVVGAGGRAQAGDRFSFTVNQATSTVGYTLSASAPFTGTMIGQDDPTQAADAQTRTKTASLFSCGTFGATENDPITISGTITATGSSSGSTTPIEPAGTFTMGIDPVSGQALVDSLSLNLAASGTPSASASLSGFKYQSFCTVNPSCTAPYLVPITLGLGTVDVTALTALQTAGAAIGTLTPAGTNSWTFSVNVPVTVSATVVYGTSVIPGTPTAGTLPLTGTITKISATAAQVTVSTTFDGSPAPVTTPTVLPASPFTVPAGSALCSGINITLNLTLTSTTVTNTDTISANADGTKVPCPCDYDGSGSVTVQDIFSFLAAWFAKSPSADFDQSGTVTVQDIFSFLSCWFSPPVGC